MSVKFTWTTPPQRMATNIDQYGERVIVAVKALADYFAQRIQDDMRTNAPWQDRTGNARSGLFSVAEMASRDVVALYLSHGHTIEYGKWLEVAHAGRYAVVMPTLEKWMPEIERQLTALLR